MKTAPNMVVSLRYTLKDDGGNVLDSSGDSQTFAYLHGHRNIIPGLEKALEGTSAGHKSHVEISPADGYGERNMDLVFEAPKEHFPKDMKLEAGTRVYAEGPEGQISFAVVEITEKGALLDGNHPLAGKKLHFDVEVIEVRPATKEELAHGHVHGEGGHHHE